MVGVGEKLIKLALLLFLLLPPATNDGNNNNTVQQQQQQQQHRKDDDGGGSSSPSGLDLCRLQSSSNHTRHFIMVFRYIQASRSESCT